MRQRYSLWTVFITALLPQPTLAFESGVNYMQALENEEPTRSLQAWAYEELKSLFDGARETLEPLLPRLGQQFSILDAEIATFIAEGQQMQEQLQTIIDNIGQREITNEAMLAEPAFIQVPEAPPVVVINGVPYTPVATEKAPLEIGMTDEGRVLLDTSGGIDLPDMTVDPRNGGEYSSELEVVQAILDLVQVTQDQVPIPIQAAASDTYNNILGNLTSDN